MTPMLMPPGQARDCQQRLNGKRPPEEQMKEDGPGVMSLNLKNVISETPNQLEAMKMVKAHTDVTTWPEVLQSGVQTGEICVITTKVPIEIQQGRRKVIKR